MSLRPIARIVTRRALQQAPRRQSGSLIIGGAALAITATTAQYLLRAHNAYQASRPKEELEAEARAREEQAKRAAEGADGQDEGKSFQATIEELLDFTSVRHYDGGFEEKMSRREAALILGVRESANKERIVDAHRRIMLLNHPDRGGSPLLAAKINEAKDILVRGKD